MKQTESKKSAAQPQKPSQALKYITLSTCVFYTIFSMIVLTTQFFGNNDLIQPLRFFLLLPFALGVSLSNLILKSRSLKTFPKHLLHFAALALSFYLCLCSTYQGSNPIVLIALLGVLYTVIATPILIVLKIRSKKNEEAQKPAYVSMFKGSEKKK